MTYSLSKEYVWKEVGDSVVVLHLDSGRYFSLNDSGSFIWKAIMDGLSLGGIVEKLTAEFNVDEASARKDTEAMIEQLATKGAISQA